ncbi:hypothetical protein TL16_g01034 [Triparma laevis f. inornata]|uniref:Uncharacterized protein n=1 Tax=Triparma laevis f. inornata TaxID=1714386 RepID=A0A9W7DQI7_9STRA|nr:hypothetical protein TL16_g01034 [Triparma laevis f. inornata]
MATQRPMTSPIPTRKKTKSTFDAELRDFMRETEMTARKIVKDANKKASDERKKEKLQKLKEQRSKSAHAGSRKVLTELQNTGNSLTSNTTSMNQMMETQVPAFDATTSPLPANVVRTVNLQGMPERTSMKTTQLNAYQASRVLSKTSSSTLRQTYTGRATEQAATTAIYRASSAFSADRNYPTKNTGIDRMRGTNAITRGIGAIEPEAISSNPSNMTLNYRSSEVQSTQARSSSASQKFRPSQTGMKGNPILDMGHFMDPADKYNPALHNKLPNGRQSNFRGAVTTASRHESLKMQRSNRPSTVATMNSPARGSSFRGATKIAMNKVNSMLRDVSTTKSKTAGNKNRKKLHKSLDSHVFNKKATSGMISTSTNKDYYKIAKDRPAWQETEPAEIHEPAIQLESAGPVSWSSEDIRVKWRDEVQREQGWKMSRAAKIAAEEMQETQNYVVPLVEMHRHPIHALFWSYLKVENELASKRAFIRANNRRFALDVHTVWLTNLPHLPEFQSGLELHPEPPPERANGLSEARDSDNIKKARSQIQSVSNKRVMKGAYFDEVERVWKRPMESPKLTTLISNESVAIENSPHPLLLSVHRLETQMREYYETAAVLVNGRWEIPASGGSEHLEPGLSVNMSDDILKLSPKKLADRDKKENSEGFFGQSFDENIDAVKTANPADVSNPERTGSTLESMKHLDAWSAASAKAFVDLPSTTKWRFSLFDPKNGNIATTQLEESVVLSRIEQYAAKVKLQYTKADPSASTANIIHRQGSRLLCDKRFYTTMVTVMVTPGPANSNSLYIDLTATVKMPRVTKEGGSFDRTQSKDSGLDGKRNEMWRDLIEQLVLVPFVEPVVEEGAESAKKGKKKGSPKRKSPKKKKKAGPSAPAPPSALEFPVNEADNIYETIAAAYSITNLVKVEGPEDPGEKYGKYDVRLPSIIGDSATLRIAGIDPTNHSDVKENVPWGNNPDVNWEFMADNPAVNLSITLTGADKYKALVPGVIEAGKEEPFTFAKMDEVIKFDKPRTRAALQIHRDRETSSTNSIQTTSILAFDTPAYAPISVFWELSEREMPLSQHEVIDPWIPMLVSFGNTLFSADVVSDLDARMAPSIWILTGSEVPLDFGGLEELSIQEKYDIERVLIGHDDFGFEKFQNKKTLKPQHNHRRRQKLQDEHGHRHNLVALKELLRPTSVINPAIFGITAKGASGNKTGVGGRTVWHSEQRCVEQLCRQRVPFDYLYVIKAKSGSGFTDPKGYTMLMNGYHLDEMVGVGLTTYNNVYKRIQGKHDLAKKREGLEGQIKQAEENLKKNRDSLQREMRMTSQKTVSRSAKFGDSKGKQPEAMSHDAWLARRECSNLLGTRAGWEKRELMNGGNVFYFKEVVAGGEVQCSWDEPEEYGEGGESEIKPGMMVGDEIPADGNIPDGETTEEMKANAERAKMAMLVKLIGEDEGLVQVLAKKLGVLIAKDKGENLDEAVRMRKEESEDMKRFPGKATRELADEDDPWSDSDEEQGNWGEGEANGAHDLLGDNNLKSATVLPQHHGDVAKERRRGRKEGTPEKIGIMKKPSNVPKLKMKPERGEGVCIGDNDDSMHIEKHIKGVGWRRLNRARVAPNFYDKITKPKPIKTKEAFTNSLSSYRGATMVDPAKVSRATEFDFAGEHKFESLFIQDVLGDGLRVVEATRMRKEREEELLAGGGLEEIAANQPSAMTLADQHNERPKNLEDEDDVEKLSHKAIECCRTGNITDLEFILDRNIVDVDVKDENGNSLLHLCCQQGNKRMVKFMLRRGADIKTQNAAGNSVLHHCHLYSHTDLAAYLLSKGADDSLVNAEGCTCYEGLSQDAVEDI